MAPHVRKHEKKPWIFNQHMFTRSSTYNTHVQTVYCIQFYIAICNARKIRKGTFKRITGKLSMQ